MTLREWAAEGPFTLALSSAFFGFYAHAGITSALSEHGLRARKFTGSSAGALIGAYLASGLRHEEIYDLLTSVRKEDFWDPAPGLGLLRGEKFRGLLKTHLAPDFGSVKHPLEIAVFDLFSCRTRFLSEGSIPAAVAASCAVPGLFHPVRIGRRYYYDGGLFLKSGLRQDLAEERVLCLYLESQGWSGAYERRTTFSSPMKNRRVLRFTGLPSLNYDRLDRGPQAHEEARERTRKAMDRPFVGDVIDA